jgi:hypothetical protein
MKLDRPAEVVAAMRLEAAANTAGAAPKRTPEQADSGSAATHQRWDRPCARSSSSPRNHPPPPARLPPIAALT